MSGRLVLVGTPIGNLGDLSPRAADVLRTADVIACEDTRRVRQLLSHLGIPSGGRLLTVNEHNEAEQAVRLVGRVAEGATVAVVTDAGMPGISDPGERLVAAAVAAGLPVEVVPGASAAITALVVSGLPTARFAFEGFLPRKGKARAERLADLAADPRTTVVFEAPHRVAETVADLRAACGLDRRVAIARELTKLHEEVWRGTLGEADVTDPRGEYVLVIDGAPPPAAPDEAAIDAALRAHLDAGTDKRAAIAKVAAQLRVPKRQVYDAALHLNR